jgi:hypothetical protein
VAADLGGAPPPRRPGGALGAATPSGGLATGSAGIGYRVEKMERALAPPPARRPRRWPSYGVARNRRPRWKN